MQCYSGTIRWDSRPPAIVNRMNDLRMIHEILPVGWLHCNCSILGDPETHEALVLDPGDNVERILETLARHSLKVRAIVSTHAHIDHVGGLLKLQQATGAPVMMHGDDLKLYGHLDVQAAWLGVPVPETAKVDRVLEEGDTLHWGRFAADVLHTPGHTPGSISLYMPNVRGGTGARAAGARESGGTTHAASMLQATADDKPASIVTSGALFAGDTLFAGSIGRTDLWEGSLDDILRSIHQKLLILPDDTSVYPGHGASTTIAEERARNPFLRER